MTTIRVTKRTRYAIVAQETVNDSSLSFRARGVLFWLLEKPDDWRCDSASLSRSGTEGREAVRTALRELEDAGYLRRTKTHGEGGHWKTIVEVHERPTSAQESGAGSPGAGKPGVGFLGAKRPSTKTKNSDQESSSSGSHTRGAPEAAEEETATPDPVNEAARLHAQRAFQNRTGTVDNPAAWKRGARLAWLEEFTAEATAILAEYPNLDGKGLLGKIEHQSSDGLGYKLTGAPDLPVIDDDEAARCRATIAEAKAETLANRKQAS